ncbi:MAG: rcc01693 family protein [Pseudomonadota bacterium]
MNRFDWPALLRVGLQGLRLRPEAFWALTPYELTVLLGKDGQGAPLSRAGLDRLAQAFPDSKGEE